MTTDTEKDLIDYVWGRDFCILTVFNVNRASVIEVTSIAVTSKHASYCNVKNDDIGVNVCFEI